VEVPFTATALASALVDAVVLGVALRGRGGALGMGRLLRAAGITALVFALKAAVLTRVVGSFFFTIHLAYVLGVVLVPAAGLALLLLARGARSTRGVKAFAALALLFAPLGYWGTFVEPFRLVSEHVTVALAPERAGEGELRVAVLADLPSCEVDDHLREALRRALAFEPHLILLPGDLMQCTGPGHRERAVVQFRALLAELHAPLGVWFAHGNCDWPPTVARAFEGTDVRILRNETVRLAHGGREVVLAGADMGGRAADFLDGLGRDLGEREVLLLMAHYPDAVLELPPHARVDLTIAGHTHGGQVRLPFFGPPITLSRVPRRVAGGGLHELAGNRVYVSRGVGCERASAPRVRLNCPPEVTLMTLR
jgi:predicted MPP superfamily phosphohydrolase